MLGEKLAQCGIEVVSGMARGIDTCAHRGALKIGGDTLAVLGNGVDVIYPPENSKLYHDIVGRGAVLSELPLEQVLNPDTFPEGTVLSAGFP